MNDATRVEWRDWDEAAFAEAADADVPVLLSLSASWCRPCHEMDAETFAEPRIAANVNDDFVPIRVDVDRRPRVRDRYNMGGFPSTVFLTPDGSLLTGAGYLAPDGMRQVLERVRERWATSGADAGRVPRALTEGEPPWGELSTAVVERMAAVLEATYDERAGGWGDGPKFPLPDAVEFALKRDRRMALRSLDAVSANLLDEYDGGFYRFAEERDWSGLHREKLLDTNAALVRAFANAYLYTGRDEYREPASRTIDYLTTSLWRSASEGADGPTAAFANSQAPPEPTMDTLSPTDREAGDEPPVDETVFAGANALAIDALLTYGAYTDDERAHRYAERTLETVRDQFVEGGVVIHYRGDTDAPQCLLTDQARVVGALTTAHSVLGAEALSLAERIAEVTIDRLQVGGSLIDGPPEGLGLVEHPLRPLDANVAFADALVDLAVVADEPRYRSVAREILESFARASDRFDGQVAAYASTAGRLLEDPLELRVGDVAGSDLHRAALRVADHEKVVVPNDDGVADGVVEIRLGDRTAEPATSPAGVAERVGELFA